MLVSVLEKLTLLYGSLEINFKDIDAILITHEHIDHTKSLPLIAKKYNIVSNNIIIFENEKEFTINNLIIFPFSTPHDAADPCGFNISDGKRKISIATDLGTINPKIIKHLENSSFIMLESNYDSNVLQYSSYPYLLKKRISGPNGHLENAVAGQTIAHLINTGLKNALLIHLSKENNFPELAYKTVVEELQKQNFLENTISLQIAPRDFPSSLFQVI